MTAPLVFLDTETDGVHPDRNVWEVAAIRREPDGTERIFEAFVSIDLSTADPFGLRVGRFYDRHPQGRYLAGLTHESPVPHLGRRGIVGLLDTWDAADQIARITYGAHLVGAVPSFDAEVLDHLLRRHKLTPAWHYHLIDVEALAVGYLHGRGEQLAGTPWSSNALSDALGIPQVPREDRHTALGDARWARAMYDAVTGGDRAPAS